MVQVTIMQLDSTAWSPLSKCALTKLVLQPLTYFTYGLFPNCKKTGYTSHGTQAIDVRADLSLQQSIHRAHSHKPKGHSV